MSKFQNSPLARLALCMFLLLIFGMLIAGFHYFAVDLPSRNAVAVPMNDANPACYQECLAQLISCRAGSIDYCTDHVSNGRNYGELQACERKYEEACSDADIKCIYSCPTA